MKLTGDDGKAFMLGIVSSIVAVIIWDLVKKKYKFLEHGEKELIKEVKNTMENITGNQA
jgi:hypothetical protein